MFFKKKNTQKCKRCNATTSKDYSYCPYCGAALFDREKEIEDFGMLGRNDVIDEEIASSFLGDNPSITDKMINSIFNSMMKVLNKQLREMSNQEINDLSNAEIKQFPNGIKISFGMPVKKFKQSQQPSKHKNYMQKEISPAQIEKMSKLPRAEAKTKVRRLSNKVIYELDIPGISSVEDVFISKLESGYEIKAIGSKKVYVNSLPITLPLKDLSVNNNKLIVEFKSE